MRDLATDDAQTPRQRWMAVLARASRSQLADVLERHGGVPRHEVLKAAEVGTVMVEARAGGTGVRFNLGEATVSRAVVRLESGVIGVSYALGSDRQKALLAALLDGLLQSPASTRSIAQEVEELALGQQEARDLASRKAAATKVDFFTLVRGSE